MTAPADTLHPIAIALVMVNFAGKYGVDATSCLLGTDIQVEQLQDADSLISRDQEMRLVENLILALPNQPALGFELGLQYNLATFGPWGFALRTSRNLREMVIRGLRYLPLSTAYCEFSVVNNKTEFGLEVKPVDIPHHLRQFLLERDIATSIKLIKELSLESVSEISLELTGAQSDDCDRIAELCGIRPRYASSRNAVILDHNVADIPQPMYDPHFVRLLEDQCTAQLKRRQVDGITGQLRQLLLGPLGLATSLEECASHLALSPRSLRRKLSDEDTSFRDVVEGERKLLASRLLQGTDMKIEELAIQLGYTDTASFNRAFKRWFAQSPGEYRTDIKGGSLPPSLE